MRKIREILRLRHEQGLSHREIAQACVIGPGTVSRYLSGRCAAGSAGRTLKFTSQGFEKE